MNNLYEFNFDCGRSGSLVGRFLATPEEVSAIIGKDVYFGEVLGKNSEISGEIDKDEITMITDNQDFIKMSSDLGITLESGINPISSYICIECGNEMDVVNNKCTECNYKG